MDLLLLSGNAGSSVRGHIDRVEPRADNSLVLVGWAHDPANPDDLVDIEIVDDTTVVASGRTGGYRQDLKKEGFGDGFCGLTIQLPEGLLDDRQEHKFHLRVAGTDLPITPQVPVRKNDYVGHVDGIDGGVLSGWATGPSDPEAPVEIDILVDGNFVDRVSADQPRNDVPQYYGRKRCGFRWAVLPGFDDGKPHRIAVQIANTSIVLSKPITYVAGDLRSEPLFPFLTAIPPVLRKERRYMAYIDEYYRTSRLAIEAVAADIAIYSGHAAHEFAILLARHFRQAYTGPLDRVMSNPTSGIEAASSTLYVLHVDLTLFSGRCLTGVGNYFFSERIRTLQPTILIVESPDQSGGLDHFDLDHARAWCSEMVDAAHAQGMTASLQSTLIDFFFGHPGFLVSFGPANTPPAPG